MTDTSLHVESLRAEIADLRKRIARDELVKSCLRQLINSQVNTICDMFCDAELQINALKAEIANLKKT